MAKKKSSKDTEAKGFQYSVELYGLLLVLIGVIGFGNFGPVGRIIRNFAIFLMGTWYAIVLFLVLILGIFMVVKRKMPKFFSSRLIGFYVLVLAILIMSHTSFIEQEGLKGKEIFELTINNLLEAKDGSSSIVGGGIIGAGFAVLFTKLFEFTGTKIIVYVLIAFGLVMLLDITLADIFAKIVLVFKWIGKKLKPNKKIKSDNSADAQETEENDKVIITSVDDLKVHNTPNEEIKVNSEPVRVVHNSSYQLPPLSLLDDPEKLTKNSTEFIRSNKLILERVMNDFQVKGKVVEIHQGPSVTQFEIKIEAGTKVSKIVSIKDELKLALAVREIRIQAPIPGKNTIGIEIPNPVTSAVRIKEILTSVPKSMESAKLLVVLGKDIMGRSQFADISKMPHLLVAGSTGSGKSVCINCFIASILMKYTPEEVKLVLVDPKKVELSHYNGIPHLKYPVVTDPKKANLTLQAIVAEMDKRYNMFSENDFKNITAYNEWVDKELRKNPEKNIEKMPYIIVIIDELADLMLVAAKEVEDSIMRITQMARAAGIHLIVATQRPSTDVITGVVKANIPSRIAFTVATSIDSRTILDMGGADKLIGKGDMLYLPMGENAPVRIQGSFISDAEIKRIIEFVSKEQSATYDEDVTEASHMAGSNSTGDDYDEPLYNEIVEFAVKTGKISASLLQRRFRLGYNRAARIVDLLEERGIIGPMNGSKPREVLVKLEDKNEIGEE